VTEKDNAGVLVIVFCAIAVIFLLVCKFADPW